MSSSRVTAIVLKRSNFSEADKIITLFSKERGKIRVVAKGIRRIKSRRAPHLELFNLVTVVLHSGKAFDLVSEAKSEHRSVDDLKTAGYLFYICEVLDKILPEEQPHPEIFEMATEIFKNVSQRQVKEFVIQLLWNLGYLPRGQYPKDGITDFVEQITERKIRSKKFLEEI